ncbi:MAG: autotransporter-associated beta strand repeat-containing protein [bacterium]
MSVEVTDTKGGKKQMNTGMNMNKIIGQWIAVIVMALAAGTVGAATGTWTGSAGATWDTSAANWTGVSGTPWDSVNGTNNRAIFTNSPTPSVSGTVYAGGFYVGSGSGIPTTLVISNGTLNLGGGTDWVAIGGRTKEGVDTVANGCTLTINGGTVNFLNNGASTVYFNPYSGTASTLNLNGGTVSTVTGFTDGSGSGSSFNFNGGTLQFAASPQLPFNGKMYLNVQAGGAILNTGGYDVTITNGTMSAPLQHSGTGTDGGLTKTGVGKLTLVAANTYDGATTINTGTLALSSSGSLNTTSSVSIAAGATFDVSAHATYTWGSNAGLTASGTTTPAILKGGSTGVNLGSRPATLNFTPATFTGDSTRPALNVSAGTLNLGTSTVTVTNNAGTPLGAGDYTLITGTVSGTPSLTPVIGGSGLVAGASASLLVSSGNLILHVSGSAPTTTTLALRSPWTSSSTYGDALEFDVTVTGTSPSGTVMVRDGGVGGTVIGTGTLSGGSVTVTLNPLNALTAGAHANIVAVYLGDSGNAASASTALGTQTVAKKALTIASATALNKPYDGNATATLTGTLAGVVSPDSVTLTLSGHFADAITGTNKSVTSTSTIDVPSQANYTLTQPAGLTANIVSFTWTNLSGGDWGTPANWLDSLVGDGDGITSLFSTLNLTADTTVRLDSPRTAGRLFFGDTDTNTAAGWLLDNGGTPANTLTLAGATPTVTVNALGGGKAVTIGAVVAGSAGLTKNGAGTLILSATNTYTGVTDVSDGTLIISGTFTMAYNVSNYFAIGNGRLNTMGTTVIASGANVNIGSNAVLIGGNRPTGLGGGGAGVGTLTINGGTLTVGAGAGGGVVDDSRIWLSPYAVSSGSTLNLNGGVLSTARQIASGWLGSTTVVNFNGGTLQAQASLDLLINSLTTANIASGGLIFDSQAFSATIGKSLSGVGGLTKVGSGMLTLGTNNTYNGATTVSNGVLKLSATGSISNSYVINVANGAVFDVSAWTSGYTLTNNTILAGNGLVTGSVVVASGAGVSGGGTNDIGTLTFTNSLTLSAGAVVYWNYTATTADVINVTGTLNLPNVATVMVSKVSGSMPNGAVLFTCGASGTPDGTTLSNWVITGDKKPNNQVIVRTVAGQKQVQLVSPTGMILELY